jgi:phosphoenolpyruvate carboxykinase (ATP)
MPIKATRALLNAALDGSLAGAEYRIDPVFGFAVPAHVDGVDPKILNPRETWDEPEAYDQQAEKLASMFVANFEKFEAHVQSYVRAAAPRPDKAKAAPA